VEVVSRGGDVHDLPVGALYLHALVFPHRGYDIGVLVHLEGLIGRCHIEEVGLIHI
jgi:hypothetical protein